MKNIKEIASGDKYVPWETLAGSIDDNFTELNNGKIDKSSISQTIGTSTTAVMSQNVVSNNITTLQTNITALGEATKNELTKLGDKITQTNNNLFRNDPSGYLSWKPNKAYNEGDVVTHDGQIMECMRGGSPASEEFNPDDWESTTVDQQSKKRDNEIKTNLASTDNKASSVGFAICKTNGSDSAKTITVYGITEITTNLRLLVQMNNVNTATGVVTLNINNLGAKTLYYNGATVSPTNTWKTGEMVELYYAYDTFRCITFGGKTSDLPIFYLNGLSASISSLPIKKSDVELWFGSYVWSDIYDKINGKMIVDKPDKDGLSSIIPVAYVITGDLSSGNISLYLTLFAQTNSVLVGLIFANGEFTSGSSKVSTFIEEAPMDGKNYVRKNGEWVEATSASPILSSIMYYSEDNYSSHTAEILSEYDRIISDLNDGKRVLAQIHTDGPIETSIGSDGINTISGSCTCDLYLLRDHESGSNLDRITGSVLTTTRRLTRSVYVNRVTREVQVIDENY